MQIHILFSAVALLCVATVGVDGAPVDGGCAAETLGCDFQSEIDAASLAGGGRVVVPPGRHVTGSLLLKSNVELHLAEGAVLVGSCDKKDYVALRPRYSEGDLLGVVMADCATNVAITGKGEIFGDGRKWLRGIATSNSEGQRPRGIVFKDCSDVRLEDFTLRDAACWGCVFHCCDGVTVRRVKIDSHANWNNDGFDIEAKNVLIEDCVVDSGDDAYVLKSNNRDFVVENVIVRNCIGRSTCNVFKLGTASHGTMRNILFENCRAEASERVFLDAEGKDWFADYRKKCWAGATDGQQSLSAIAVECVDGGVVSNIVFRGIDARNTLVPIFVRGGTRRNRGNGIPPNDKHILSDVLIENVTAKAESFVASSITGVEGCRPKNVVLRNVRVACKGGGETAQERTRPVPEFPGSYPESRMFKCMLPAYGLYVRHVDGMRLENAVFTLQGGTSDERDAVVRDDVADLAGPGAGAALAGGGGNRDAAHERRDFQREIDAAHDAGGGCVTVHAGVWDTGPLHLRSNVELHLEEGATLRFSENPDDYLPKVATSWQGEEMKNLSPLVYAAFATNVAITGRGLLTTGNAAWNRWFKENKTRRRPQFVQFFCCGKVRLEGFSVRGSPFWTIHLYRTDDAVVKGLDVSAFDEKGFALKNTDGIDIECSRRVRVSHCTFRQGDDAIVLKSGRDDDGIRRGIPTEDVTIENCRVREGHVLLGVGSEVGGGIRNVLMRDCTVEGSVDRLLFVKTNAKRGGFIENIAMERVRADKVRQAVVALMADYWYYPPPGATNLHRTAIRGVTVRDVTVSDAGSVAELRGDPDLPARDFEVSGVTVDTVRRKIVDAANVENLRVDGLQVRHPPSVSFKKNDPTRGGQEK